MAEPRAEVELGFVEECSSKDEFDSSCFPSKIGGKPVWLDPVALPTVDQLLCRECQMPCVLLLQVYAPHTDDPATFHRTLYVFMCTNAECSRLGSTKPFRVYRCQLPKRNPYYQEENGSCLEEIEKIETRGTEAPPSDHSLLDIKLTSRPSLCVVCGSPGPSRCGQCVSVHYCSQHHQIIDWKNGHKGMCKDLKSGKALPKGLVRSADSVLLPEFQIITDAEPDDSEYKNRKTDEERLQEYAEYVSSESYKTRCSRNPGLFDELSKVPPVKGGEEHKKDKCFNTFKKRVSREPEQVLRFQPGGEPLLISDLNAPIQPSPCESCGGQRQFELQIMPQLLYYLKLDTSSGKGIDWGTLFVYTCANNCNASPGYREEFLCKQDL